jgi:hypothetical protein
VLKELPQNWETRPDSRRVRQGLPGINNRLETSGRESDGLVVATKRGKTPWSQGALLHTRIHL